MIHTFSKSCIGYNHIKEKLPCQDHSAIYKDNERIIITCCDGHGSKKYIRSHKGSHMASNAVMKVFNSINTNLIKPDNTEIENKIKLSILCEWNKLIEDDYYSKPIRKAELENLSNEDIHSIKNNYIKAYGTTLTGALILSNKLVVVKIGDSECFLLKKGELINIFNDEEEPVANITHSLCQDDAFNYLKVKILNFKDFDGIFLCTDGLTSPYQSYENFKNSFVKPFINKLIKEKSNEYIEEFIEKMAGELGIGDDVSLSFVVKDNTALKYYK